MSLLDRRLTDDEFASLDWQSLIVGIDPSEHRWKAASQILKRSREMAESGDTISSQALKVIAGAMSMQLLHGTHRAFGPMIQTQEGRSFSIEDLGEHDVDLLARAARETQDAWIRARFADLAITADQRRPPDWQLGRLAVEAYIDYIDAVFGTDRAIDALDECERALILFWVYAKPDEALWVRLWRLITAEVAHACERNWPGLVFRLCDQALRRNKAACELILPSVEAKAAELDVAAPQDAARYHHRVYRIKQRLKDLAGANGALLAQGEALVRTAIVAGEAQPLLAPHWIVEAIAILRRARATPSRIAELRDLLATYERASLDHYQGHDFKTDVSEWVKWIEARVVGPTLFQALLQMAFLAGRWLDFDEIEDGVRHDATEHPLSRLFGSQHANADGVVVATQEPLDLDDPQSVYAQMVVDARQFHLDARGQILVSRVSDLLYSSYQPSFFAITEIVEASPVTPDGRAETIARGLYAGIIGDWLGASVYLIPSMEALIRTQLNRYGTATTQVREDGTQQEKALTELLDMPEAEAFFGKGLLLELRALLTHPLGFNLRHQYCHGLLRDDQLQSTGTLALWWSLWRMLLFPWRQHPAITEQPDQAAEPNPHV